MSVERRRDEQFRHQYAYTPRTRTLHNTHAYTPRNSRVHATHAHTPLTRTRHSRVHATHAHIPFTRTCHARVHTTYVCTPRHAYKPHVHVMSRTRTRYYQLPNSTIIHIITGIYHATHAYTPRHTRVRRQTSKGPKSEPRPTLLGNLGVDLI